MVCGVGLAAPATARGRIPRGRRDSLGTRLTGRQLLDGHLSNRRWVSTFAVGGQAALASQPASRSESTRAGGGERFAVCVQRYVEALPASHRGPGGSGFTRAGPVSYHQPSEPGGGSG